MNQRDGEQPSVPPDGRPAEQQPACAATSRWTGPTTSTSPGATSSSSWC